MRDHDDPDWVRERKRELAEGARRHWNSDDGKPRVRSQVRGLRNFQTHRARLDIVCRRRLIARVLAKDEHAYGFEVAMEAIGASGGQTATIAHPDGRLTAGYGLNLIDVETGPIAVGCRCSRQIHQLIPMLLNAEARMFAPRPGKPRVVSVSRVVNGD